MTSAHPDFPLFHFPGLVGAIGALALLGACTSGSDDDTALDITPDSTLWVTTTDDAGEGSLRAAIVQANEQDGADVIHFAIPGMGPHTIALASELPVIVDAVEIDGFSQTADEHHIVIDGSGLQAAEEGLSGLHIAAASDCAITGLVIQTFVGHESSAGIRVAGDAHNNRIAHNQLLGAVNGVLFTEAASENIAEENLVDGLAGPLELETQSPLDDEAFLESRRLVDGFLSYGIYLDTGTAENDVVGNHIQRVHRGVALLSSNDNRVVSNTTVAIGNQGYILVGSDDNEVSENHCDLAGREGIELWNSGGHGSERNVITDNTITRSGFRDPGIAQLYLGTFATDNVVTGNTVLDSFSNGIILYEGAEGNTVADNEVDGLDRSGIVIFAAPAASGGPVAPPTVNSNVFEGNTFQDYSRAEGYPAIQLLGHVADNDFRDNTLGAPASGAPSAISLALYQGYCPNGNRFSRNVHEGSGLLWELDDCVVDTMVCEPTLPDGILLDLDSQFVGPEGQGNVVLETCPE